MEKRINKVPMFEKIINLFFISNFFVMAIFFAIEARIAMTYGAINPLSVISLIGCFVVSYYMGEDINKENF